ncbi:MAG: hypothetical protein HY376_03190 [Candidatus Blackburnbacteria bacterium]|nr:hypothetical protein [Candidatus Blackburnbacteria bacterium]
MNGKTTEKKAWEKHLKICTHNCKDTPKQRDVFQVGFNAAFSEAEKEVATMKEEFNLKHKQIIDGVRAEEKCNSDVLWRQKIRETINKWAAISEDCKMERAWYVELEQELLGEKK